MTVQDMDWFLERVEVARENTTTPGMRDVHAACPVCRSADNLHITEHNGRALLKCFGCSAKYDDIVAALTTTDDTADEEPQQEEVTAPVIRKRRTSAVVPANVELDPAAWYSEYCGIPWADIESLVVRVDGEWLEHGWPDGRVWKGRKAGTADRRWTPKGATPPRLWPLLEPAEEIWLCEGESDVIVMRLGYGLPAYTAGSATTLLTVDEFHALKRKGVDRVVIAYDNDKAGQKATAEVLANAREAGIGAVVAQLADPFVGGPKDWRERWLSGDDTLPTYASDNLEEDYPVLTSVPTAPETELLLGFLHPTAHTILFGDGGTGKGVIAAWWATQLTQLGKRVLVLDWEKNAQHEWKPRISTFGEDTATDMVRYNQPTRAIWDEVGDIRTAIQEFHTDYVIVDSITYACVGEEVERSSTAAKYSLAIAQLPVPVLSLAHTTKVEPAPKHPFGSVFWSNGARITINVALSDPKNYGSPRRVTCKKTNQVAPFAPQDVPWDWVTTGLPHELEFDAVVEGLDTRIALAIASIGHFGTASQIHAAMLIDGGLAVEQQSISNRLSAQKKSDQPYAVMRGGRVWHDLTPH